MAAIPIKCPHCAAEFDARSCRYVEMVPMTMELVPYEEGDPPNLVNVESQSYKYYAEAADDDGFECKNCFGTIPVPAYVDLEFV